ncbi:hypothetical protein [Oceanobacillus profundus]|uniref:Uncharacterized protein n=1 Tax=Oceanobacillus profundus TaxID=372463 RepID=A0A417YMP8_9BACI|nr:hypothetical protein [Oceanobacillus profundus]RHW35045.1 hypothetical protein D1B32_00010 [Oceanobacillus profundus]
MDKSMVKYWRVICRYGHVGKRNEVSVSRYLQTESTCNLIDVLAIVSEMPGVKKGNNIVHSVIKAERINREQYENGKEEEGKNLYLQKLMAFKPRATTNIA